MSEDARHRKGHASKVAVGVSNEDARGEPVVLRRQAGRHKVKGTSEEGEVKRAQTKQGTARRVRFSGCDSVVLQRQVT